MLRHSFFILLSSLLLMAARSWAAEPITAIPIADVRGQRTVSFANDVLPLLKKNCLACHNGNDAEHDLSLETPEAICKGGADGPVIAPGNAAQSRLLQLAAHQREPIMPPADNKVGAAALTPEELGLLKLWIDQGAQGEAAAVRRVVERHALVGGLQPILALAITSDDEYVACSRGDRLFVYHLPEMRLAAELTDPSIGSRRAADEDLIRSLAFARSGDLLASGGFRTVRLWRRPRSRVERDIGGPSPASAIAVSGDGKLLANGTPAGTIELYDLASNQPGGGSRTRGEAPSPQPSPGGRGSTVTLAGHEGAVVGLALSTDGVRLYSAGADKTIRAWAAAEAKEVGKIAATADVRALALLPGDTQLATVHADQVIYLWDISAGTPLALRELKGHARPVTCLTPVSAERLLSAGEEGRLRLWNTVTGETVREFDHGAPVVALAVRPDGKRLASAGSNGVVRLWNTDDGSMVVEIKGDPRAARALGRADAALNYAKACVEYRKQEHREAEEQLKRETGTVEGAMKAKEQAEKTVTQKTEPAQKAIAARLAAEEAIKPTADALAAAMQAQTAAQATVAEAEKALSQAAADATKAREAAEQDKDNKDLAAARDAADKALAEAKQNKQAADAALQKTTQALREAQRKNEEAKQAARRAAEQARQPQRQLEEAKSALQGAINFIATANAVLERAKAAVPAAQQKVADAEALVARRESEKKTLTDAAQAPPKRLRAVAFLADSSRLAVAGEGTGLCFYDAEKGVPLEVLESPSKVTGLTTTSDGLLFASDADGRTAIIKIAGDWTLERTIGRADDPDQLVDRVLSLDFSPDGKRLATGSGLAARSGQLKLWNVADGTLLYEVAAAHRDTIYGLRFSPDGQYLATASADRLAKIFRVADGGLVRTLEGHTHHVLGVAWSSDGRCLATAGGDQTVKLWNVGTGAPLRTIRGDAYRIGPYKREVTSIGFIGDTEHIVASSGDGTVRLHRTSSDRDLRAFKEGVTFTHAAVATSDGRLIFGGGRDGMLYVFNGETGYKVTELKPEP